MGPRNTENGKLIGKPEFTNLRQVSNLVKSTDAGHTPSQ